MSILPRSVVMSSAASAPTSKERSKVNRCAAAGEATTRRAMASMAEGRVGRTDRVY